MPRMRTAAPYPTLRVQPRWVAVAIPAWVALPAARVTPATATPMVWPTWRVAELTPAAGAGLLGWHGRDGGVGDGRARAWPPPEPGQVQHHRADRQGCPPWLGPPRPGPRGR